MTKWVNEDIPGGGVCSDLVVGKKYRALAERKIISVIGNRVTQAEAGEWDKGPSHTEPHRTLRGF